MQVFVKSFPIFLKKVNQLQLKYQNKNKLIQKIATLLSA